jgi:hypothetical protein
VPKARRDDDVSSSNDINGDDMYVYWQPCVDDGAVTLIVRSTVASNLTCVCLPRQPSTSHLYLYLYLRNSPLAVCCLLIC